MARVGSMTTLESISPASQDYVKGIYALESRTRRKCDHERAGGAARRVGRVGVGDGAKAGRCRPGRAHPLPRRAADRRGGGGSRSRSSATTGCSRPSWSGSWACPGTVCTPRRRCWSTSCPRQLEQRIAEKLGHPARDPHGDPIPSAELELDEQPTERLDGSGTPAPADASCEFPTPTRRCSSYLADLGIAPGDGCEVLERQPFDGPLVVRFGDRTHAIGGRLAASMRIEVA